MNASAKPVIRPPTSEQFYHIRSLAKDLELHTVCAEARCPNQSDCWSVGTATFMVMGDECTRGCRFCAVKTRRTPRPLDASEPKKLASAVKTMKLDYVVITSVNRDELLDQGAAHFAECIREVKQENPGIGVEVLTPDFRGSVECIQTVLEAKPDVFAHNIETVERLQGKVRDPRANYGQSLNVLETIKALSPNTFTKSSIMLGLGETKEETVQCMKDLRNAGVDFLTLGQYLQPSPLQLPVKEFVSMELFKELERDALELGFQYCASGPLVRSSYKAGEYFVKRALNR